MILRIVEHEVHFLAGVQLLHGGEETLPHPSNKLVTVYSVVIISGGDAIYAHLVEDERAAVVQFGEDVARFHIPPAAGRPLSWRA